MKPQLSAELDTSRGKWENLTFKYIFIHTLYMDIRYFSFLGWLGWAVPLFSTLSVKTELACLPSNGKTENTFLSAQTERVSLARQSLERYSWTHNSSRYQVSLNEDIKTRSYSHAATSECHLSLSCPSLPSHPVLIISLTLLSHPPTVMVSL